MNGIVFGVAAALFAQPWTFEPNQPNAYLARALAGAGDVNGDGFADLLVGAYEYNGGFSNEGRAYLFLGSLTGLPAAPSWFVEHTQPYAFFGYGVAGAGDVNGDGFDDLLVGARQFNGTYFRGGAAYLFFGAAWGPATQPDWSVLGDQTGAMLGTTVSAAGDVNGDGFADLLVVAPEYDGAAPDGGRVYLFLGGASGPTTQPVWTFDGDEAGAGVGMSVAAAGDVDGDGFADVLMGIPQRDVPAIDAGEVRLFRGGLNGLAAQAVWTISGDQAGASFGASVACAGDVDSDGFSDLLIGAPLRDETTTDEGRIYLFRGGASGPAMQPDWTFDGGQLWANFGASVAGAIDFDGDGHGDVVVGAPFYDAAQVNQGALVLFRGSAGGLSRSPRWFALGEQGGSRFGAAVAGAGDVNGDGRGDLVVGAWLFSNGQTGEGRAYLFAGRALPRGDLNGDGVVNGADAQAFVDGTVAGCLVCDLNGDGAVDAADAAALVSAALGE